MQKIKFLIGAVVFFGVFLITSRASAAVEGIQISPLTYNYEIAENQSEEAKIIVTNLNDEPLTYICETEIFSKVSDDGAPSFAVEDRKEGVTTLADWITFIDPKEGTIPAKGEREIHFKITIPEGAEPGGHYAAVFARQVKKTESGTTEIGISGRVGTLILVSVPGETNKSGEIVSFQSPAFVSSGPVNFEMKVKNSGTVHYDSKGQVELKPLLGESIKVDLGTHTIVPNNERNYKGLWNVKYPFGYFKITATATDGAGNPITTSSTLWAIPLIIVIPALVGLFLLILIIRYIRKHFKVVKAE